MAAVGRIVDTACVTGCDLATNCGLTVVDVKPVTVAALTGELKTVGVPLI